MKNNDFLSIVDIKYFTPDNAVFYESVNGFPCLKAFLPKVSEDDLDDEAVGEPEWQDLGRVFFHRSFPYDAKNSFISVMDKDGKEYGMIRNIDDFDDSAKKIIEKELNRKYFTPKVVKINSVKERFGYSYWEVETEYGKASFAMHDTYRSISRVSETRLILNDSDGNRYEIPDITVLDKKSYRRIELYL